MVLPQSEDRLPAASTLGAPSRPLLLVYLGSPLPRQATSQPGVLLTSPRREWKLWGLPAPPPPSACPLWALLRFDMSRSITRLFCPVTWTSCHAASTVTLLSTTHAQQRDQEPLRLSLEPPCSERFPPSGAVPSTEVRGPCLLPSCPWLNATTPGLPPGLLCLFPVTAGARCITT